MNNLIYHPYLPYRIFETVKTIFFRGLVGLAKEDGGWDGTEFQVGCGGDAYNGFEKDIQ